MSLPLAPSLNFAQCSVKRKSEALPSDWYAPRDLFPATMPTAYKIHQAWSIRLFNDASISKMICVFLRMNNNNTNFYMTLVNVARDYVPLSLGIGLLFRATWCPTFLPVVHRCMSSNVITKVSGSSYSWNTVVVIIIIIFSCLIIKLDRTQNDTISMNGW